MTNREPATIEREQLARKLETDAPDNEDPRRGFALVNVLPAESFERAHIPGSMNIPMQQAGRFETRFEKGKEIVLYCASPQCDASEQVAAALVRRGFERVVDYPGGVSDWRAGGLAIEGREV